MEQSIYVIKSGSEQGITLGGEILGAFTDIDKALACNDANYGSSFYHLIDGEIYPKGKTSEFNPSRLKKNS